MKLARIVNQVVTSFNHDGAEGKSCTQSYNPEPFSSLEGEAADDELNAYMALCLPGVSQSHEGNEDQHIGTHFVGNNQRITEDIPGKYFSEDHNHEDNDYPRRYITT